MKSPLDAWRAGARAPLVLVGILAALLAAIVICEAIGIPEDQQLVCGMSLGWRDPGAIENTLITEREPVARFTRFLD